MLSLNSFGSVMKTTMTIKIRAASGGGRNFSKIFDRYLKRKRAKEQKDKKNKKTKQQNKDIIMEKYLKKTIFGSKIIFRIGFLCVLA